MRRHAGGIGCGARGRERTLLPHPGGAGSSARRPIRAVRQEHGCRGPPPVVRFAQNAKPDGRNGRSLQSAARRSKEDAAMARHEAPASLERERGTNEQWLRHLARHLPRVSGRDQRDDGVPGAGKNTGDDARAMLFDN
jgi:hypothetical protein